MLPEFLALLGGTAVGFVIGLLIGRMDRQVDFALHTDTTLHTHDKTIEADSGEEIAARQDPEEL